MKAVAQQLKKRAADETGSSLVEFAMIGVLFLFLTGLIIQGALLFNAWLVTTNAVREGSRRGGPCFQRPVNPCSTGDIQTIVVQAAQAVDESQLAVTVSSGNGLLIVESAYPVPIVAPFFELVHPDPFQVRAESAMRLEN